MRISLVNMIYIDTQINYIINIKDRICHFGGNMLNDCQWEGKGS